jgi:hypothetical protein
MNDTLRRYIKDLRSSIGLLRKQGARNLGRAKDPEAVEPLKEVLKDPEDEVREEAARALGKIGVPSALPALRDLLNDPDERVKAAAEEAIALLEPLAPAVRPGAEPAAPTAAKAAPPTRAPTLEERENLVREAITGTNIRLERRPYGFKLTVPLLKGRKQKVRVVFENSDPEGDKIILIFTECGKATPKNYRWALSTNMKMAYGHMAIRRVEEGDMFICLNTLLERTTDPEEIAKSVMAIAERGDWIEKQLSKVDRY